MGRAKGVKKVRRNGGRIRVVKSGEKGEGWGKWDG
jgi:hypothetical protein